MDHSCGGLCFADYDQLHVYIYIYSYTCKAQYVFICIQIYAVLPGSKTKASDLHVAHPSQLTHRPRSLTRSSTSVELADDIR